MSSSSSAYEESLKHEQLQQLRELRRNRLMSEGILPQSPNVNVHGKPKPSSPKTFSQHEEKYKKRVSGRIQRPPPPPPGCPPPPPPKGGRNTINIGTLQRTRSKSTATTASMEGSVVSKSLSVTSSAVTVTATNTLKGFISKYGGPNDSPTAEHKSNKPKSPKSSASEAWREKCAAAVAARKPVDSEELVLEGSTSEENRVSPNVVTPEVSPRTSKGLTKLPPVSVSGSTKSFPMDEISNKSETNLLGMASNDKHPKKQVPAAATTKPGPPNDPTSPLRTTKRPTTTKPKSSKSRRSTPGKLTLLPNTSKKSGSKSVGGSIRPQNLESLVAAVVLGNTGTSTDELMDPLSSTRPFSPVLRELQDREQEKDDKSIAQAAARAVEVAASNQRIRSGGGSVTQNVGQRKEMTEPLDTDAEEHDDDFETDEDDEDVKGIIRLRPQSDDHSSVGMMSLTLEDLRQSATGRSSRGLYRSGYGSFYGPPPVDHDYPHHEHEPQPQPRFYPDAPKTQPQGLNHTAPLSARMMTAMQHNRERRPVTQDGSPPRLLPDLIESESNMGNIDMILLQEPSSIKEDVSNHEILSHHSSHHSSHAEVMEVLASATMDMDEPPALRKSGSNPSMDGSAEKAIVSDAKSTQRIEKIPSNDDSEVSFLGDEHPPKRETRGRSAGRSKNLTLKPSSASPGDQTSHAASFLSSMFDSDIALDGEQYQTQTPKTSEPPASSQKRKGYQDGVKRVRTRDASMESAGFSLYSTASAFQYENIGQNNAGLLDTDVQDGSKSPQSKSTDEDDDSNHGILIPSEIIAVAMEQNADAHAPHLVPERDPRPVTAQPHQVMFSNGARSTTTTVVLDDPLDDSSVEMAMSVDDDNDYELRPLNTNSIISQPKKYRVFSQERKHPIKPPNDDDDHSSVTFDDTHMNSKTASLVKPPPLDHQVRQPRCGYMFLLLMVICACGLGVAFYGYKFYKSGGLQGGANDESSSMTAEASDPFFRDAGSESDDLVPLVITGGSIDGNDPQAALPVVGQRDDDDDYDSTETDVDVDAMESKPFFDNLDTADPTTSPTLNPTPNIRGTAGPPTQSITTQDDDDDDDTSTKVDPPSNDSYKSITFYAIGDTPLNPVQEETLREQISNLPSYSYHPSTTTTPTTTTMTETNAFLIHLGDIQKGNADCQVAKYNTVQSILLQSPLPVFVLPGDSDIRNCPNPDQAFNYWGTRFRRFDKQWRASVSVPVSAETPAVGSIVEPQSHEMNVRYQKGYRENFRFVIGGGTGVLFVGIHATRVIEGGNDDDDLVVPSERDWDALLSNGFEWVRDAIDASESLRGVVIMGHAMIDDNPRLQTDFIARLLPYLQTKQGLPAVYLHSDGRQFMDRIPFPEEAPLFREVQIDRSGKAPPLKVTVRFDDEEWFEIDRQGGPYNPKR